LKSLLLQVCFFFFFFLFVFFFKQIGSTNHISESLGAVIDPDMSWSSSLNTPRTVTPTVLVCNSTSAAGDFMKGRKNKKNLQSFLTPVAYKGYCSSSEESYLKKVIPDDKLSNHTYKESSECLATAPSKIPSFTDSLHDTGFKTASNNTIKVYSASFDKAQSMFEETEDLYLKDQHLQKSSLCLKRCSEKEFSKSFSEADKMWCSSKLPSSNNVFLTPSQKAEVYELCSFLEEAGTQFELTQTEKTKSKSNNCNSLHSTGDQETIPSTPNVSDILNGINFDDSFNAENNTSLNTKPAMDLMMTIDSHEESCEKVCTSIQSAKTVNSLYLGKKGNDLSFSAQGKEPNGGSDVEKGVNTSTQDSVGAVTHLEGIDFHKRLLKEGEMNTETENERHIIKQQLMCPSPAENGDIASYTMVRESSNNTESREMKENNVIKGFYTASGKKLNISKNAMESATSIFEDLCPEKNWTCSYLSKSLNTSDTSESQPAKHFSVPRKVVNRSFKEVSQTNKNECKPSYFPGVTVCIQNETQLNPNLAFSSNKDHSENKDQSSSVGFMSANKSFKNSNNKFMSVQGLCGLESFQTASGNVITYGQESLAKGLTLFSEEDDFSPYGDKKCSDKCDFQFENEHNSADTGIHVSKGDFGNLMDVSSSCLVSHCHKRKTDSNLPKLNDDASKRAKEMFKDSGNLNDELLTDVCLIVADGVKHHCTKPRLNDSLSSEVGELGNVQCPVSKRNFDITQVNLLNTSNNGRDGPNVSLPIDMVIFSSENRKSLQHMNSKYGTCDMTLSCGLLCNKSLIQDDLPMQHDSFVSDNSDSDGNKVGVSCVGLGTEHNVSYQKPYMLGENYTYEDSTKRANNIVTDTTAHCENFQTTAFCKNGNQNLTSEQVLKKKGTFSNIDKTLAPSVSAVSTTSRFLLHSDSEKKVCFSKTVFCEEEALLRGPDEANRIKKDIRCDAENMKQSGMPHSKCARNVAGFSTANGKTIFFSEEAFCKAKALLNDCEDRNSQICATEVMKAPHLPLENCAKNVVGFSTTSRKNIFISEKSFSDAKSLLKNCENKKLEESKSFDMVNMKVPCPPVVNYKPESAAGFNTASGKRITITEKALEDTKALFNNCDEETNDRMISSGSESTESPGLLFKNCVPSSASGFTTASGKRVQFSEKAFSEATALLKDCVDTTSEKSASSDSESLHHLVNHYTKNIQRLNVARGKMLSEKASDDTKTLLNYSKDETNEKKSISDFENTKVPDLYPPSCNSRNFARVGPRPTIHAYYKYAASFRFKFTDYFSKDAVLTSHGAQLADGGWLISDDSGTAGKEEFYRALCDTPGVDPKLITENWVYNHYSLIIWKLAAMETAFPNVFGGCCLTPERVLLQLKYRYDVEIDRCQRSAIKKITERDDSPAKTLILCISKIIANGSQPYPNIKNNTCTTSADKKKQLPTGVIEVTDGWYLIKAHLDARLTALLQSGKLSVGNKIVTNGAELIGCQDACTPLEAPESLMLKISANSTRPARWYCKLGFYCDPRPFVLPLSSLFYDGGIVGCVDVIILRSYSLQWMEKRPNGVFLFRNERAEVREAKRQEDSHQKNMEELFARVQAEFEKDLELKNKSKGKSKVKLNIQQIQALQDGAELYEAFESSTDPGFLETCLSAQQVAVLNRHKQAVNDQKQAKLQEKFRKILESSQEENSCTKRDVTPVWKLHIVDYKDLDASKVYMLNVWRPTVDLCSLLKEGDRYKIYHLAASQPKGRMGSTSVQLTVTKKTQFQQLQVSPDHLTLLYKCREAVNFRSLSNPTFQPPCEEVDLVGLVICIEGKQGGAAVVYLCDEELNFVALKTWSSLNHLAADDIIMPMTLLAASNLHFKYNSSVAIPVVYGGDLATFSGNPKEKHLHSAIEHLKKNIQNIQDFCKEAEKKLNKLKANTAGFLQSRECYTHSKQNMDKTNQVSCMSDLTIPFVYFVYAVILKPFQKLKRSVTPAKRKAVEDEESDRKSIKKKKALDFLSRIPSPPPLTPLKNIVSDSLKKGFHPPRKQTFTPETRKEETSDKSQAVLCNKPVSSNHFPEDQWVNDEELAMINTQALLGCLQEDVKNSST
uniref:Tower domain-containing protein n=1 Tax=Erpetoichthys calabaricus TaxID=27687 RepID=A0A8C4RR31_ERPCA